MSATDRRAVFVGAEAHGQSGGTILRDLFTEDGGGWFEDVRLLDRLVAEKLAGIAEDVRDKEGWKWAEPHIDFPRALGFARAYPRPVERSEEEKAQIAALSEEYDALVSEWDAVEELPPEIEARFAEIDAALEAFGDGTAFGPDEIAVAVKARDSEPPGLSNGAGEVVVLEGAGHPVDLAGGQAVLSGHVAPGGDDGSDLPGDGPCLRVAESEIGGGTKCNVE